MPESYQFSNVLNLPILSVITFLPLAGAIILIDRCLCFFLWRWEHLAQ